MSQSDCKKDLRPPKTPTGICALFETRRHSQLDCNIANSGSKYYLKVKNRKSQAVGVRVRCESVNGRVEFKGKNGNYSDSLDLSIYLKPRGTTPTIEDIEIEIQPANNRTMNEEIRTSVNINKIVTSTNPDVDECLEVSVN